MDLKTKSFWVAVSAEFLATTVLIFCICASTLSWSARKPDVLHIALTVGLAVASMALAIGHITGGLLNPSVTLAFVMTRRLSVMRGLFYLLAQVTGGKIIFKKIYTWKMCNFKN